MQHCLHEGETMTRGAALILVALACLVTVSAAWVAWYGISVYESDLYSFSMLLVGVLIGIAGSWPWRNWCGCG
jgi:DNA-binding transcriptional regulator of glucitol operon